MKRILVALLLLSYLGHSQSPEPFKKEVTDIQKKYDTIWDVSRPTIVFTGSSSVRLWKDLQERFPDRQVLNTGFGGSQFSDLALYLDDLILDYDPVKVFIYEGDNDIFAKKRPKEILEISEKIIQTLRERNPNIAIILISPKPSISRWKLRGKYRRLNRRLDKLAANIEGVEFVDVWYPMLDKRKVKEDIFIEDGLHMNSKGYDIWYDVLKNYVE